MKKEVEALKQKGVDAGLAVIIVGDDPASKIYVGRKEAMCSELGIYSEKYELGKDTTMQELKS